MINDDNDSDDDSDYDRINVKFMNSNKWITWIHFNVWSLLFTKLEWYRAGVLSCDAISN